MFLLHLHVLDSALLCCGLLLQITLTGLDSGSICLDLDFFFLFSAITLLTPMLPISAPRLCALWEAEKHRSQTARVDKRPRPGSLSPGVTSITSHCCLSPYLYEGKSPDVPEEQWRLENIVLAAGE